MSSFENAVALLSYAFVQRAFLVGALIAVISSLLSVFIVLKSISLIGDGLAHTAFGGLAFAYYAGVAPLLTAGVVVVLASMGITKVTRSTKIQSDAAVAVFLTLGLATGVLFLGLGKGYGVDLESLLFGSILLSSWNQIGLTAVVLVATVAAVFVSFQKLVLTVFNARQAEAAGIRTWAFDYLIAALTGVAVIVSIPITGVLLIAALLVLPGLTSIQVARSFRQTVALAPVFGLASVLVGIFLSLLIDVAPGSTIVLTGLAILVGAVVAKRVRAWAEQPPNTPTDPTPTSGPGARDRGSELRGTSRAGTSID
ncbi:MAG TPA: metal ABC transporter permease [Thermoplasmata archaeon]